MTDASALPHVTSWRGREVRWVQLDAPEALTAELATWLADVGRSEA